MELTFGVDTLSYHCRLEAGEITHEQICREVGALGYAFLQLNAYHLRAMSAGDLAGIREEAVSRGLGVTLSGDVVGRAITGDTVDSGVDRIRRWIGTAQAVGSPYVRVSSGFYRNELLRQPGAILAERDYLIRVLAAAVQRTPADCLILLENHSDFTPDEYVEILESVGSPKLGVFLDLINPVSMLLDPLPVVRRLLPWARAGHVKDYRLVSRYVEDGFHRRGFDVQYCYPGEGVADIGALVGTLAAAKGNGSPYYLGVEGLDNYAGRPDQQERLRGAFACLGAAASRDVEAGA